MEMLSQPSVNYKSSIKNTAFYPSVKIQFSNKGSVSNSSFPFGNGYFDYLFTEINLVYHWEIVQLLFIINIDHCPLYTI